MNEERNFGGLLLYSQLNYLTVFSSIILKMCRHLDQIYANVTQFKCYSHSQFYSKCFLGHKTLSPMEIVAYRIAGCFSTIPHDSDFQNESHNVLNTCAHSCIVVNEEILLISEGTSYCILHNNCEHSTSDK